jgi:hypothetical protein
MLFHENNGELDTLLALNFQLYDNEIFIPKSRKTGSKKNKFHPENPLLSR